MEHLRGLPGLGVVAITPSDSVDFAEPIRGFEVTVEGSVKATFYDGSIATLTARKPGVLYPYVCRKIWASGTTATGILGVT